MKNKKPKINIQFFASEGEPNPNEGQGKDNEKKYSNEEYEKLKNSFDKTSSELAELKKQLKAKMSEEEKKAELEKEKDERLKNYESKMEDYELKEELISTNIFTNEEIQKIIAKKESKKDLINGIVSLVGTKIEEAKKQAVAEFMRTSDGTGGDGKGKKEIDKDLQKFIDSGKEDSTLKAREYYLNKK